MFESVHRVLFGTEAIEVVQQTIGLGHPGPFEALSLLGDVWGIILVVGLAMWLWGRDTTYALLGVIAVGAVTKELMSMAFGMPRPEGPDIVVYEHLDVSSFPSGHVYQVLAPWSLLYAFRRVPLIVPVLVALLIGVSRLYLGVHYLGDVVFAVVFAALLVWGFAWAWPHVQPWLAERSLLFYVGLGIAAVASIVASLIVRLDNPRRWEILGMVLAGLIGFLAEQRVLDYRPPRDASLGLRAGQIALGTGGILVCFLADRLFGADARIPGLLTAGAAMLWAVYGAPAVFSALGWVQTRRTAGEAA